MRRLDHQQPNPVLLGKRHELLGARTRRRAYAKRTQPWLRCVMVPKTRPAWRSFWIMWHASGREVGLHHPRARDRCLPTTFRKALQAAPRLHHRFRALRARISS